MLTLALAPVLLGQEGPVARGKYIVESLSLCGDCHTPMLPSGQPDQSRLLRGAPLPFQGPASGPKWNTAAPDITPKGVVWKRWGEAGLKKFLETGLDPHGHPPDPPMPSYKLHVDDAEAVVAYLKTLK